MSFLDRFKLQPKYKSADPDMRVAGVQELSDSTEDMAVLAALARGESVDPSRYYFRTAPRFETSAPQYAFLNRLIAVSSGDRRASGPIYTIEEVL